DVPRPDDCLLDVDAVVTEGRLRLRAGGAEPALECVGGLDEPHPLAAAAARRLEHDRDAEVAREALDLGVRVERLVRAGYDRDARLAHQPARLDLVPHGGDRLRRRTDEDQAGVPARPREGGALREET